MTKTPPMILSEDQITIIFGTKQYTLHSDHQNYKAVIAAIKERDWAKAEEMASVQNFIATRLTENFSLNMEGEFLYKGEVLNSVTAQRLKDSVAKGYDPAVLANFLERLYQNPSRTAVNELYLFLESGHIPIAPDGRLIAYKVVRENYTDKYTGRFSNHVGAILEMPRNEVDDDRNNTCSAGFHFAALSYARDAFYSPGDRMVIVAVDPADVVSIPSDYSNTKGRTWRYEVIGEVESENIPAYSGIPEMVYGSGVYEEVEEDSWTTEDWWEWQGDDEPEF